jgi:hypothetical protein
VHAVVIIGPADLFPRVGGVTGLDVDHGQAGDVGEVHILGAHATDDAIAAIRALGLTVEVQTSEDDQRALLAQVLADAGPNANEIDVS